MYIGCLFFRSQICVLNRKIYCFLLYESDDTLSRMMRDNIIWSSLHIILGFKIIYNDHK